MHLEAVITDRLAFIAVLFCLDQAIAARDLAGGRAAHSVDLPPQSGGLEGPRGAQSHPLIPKGSSSPGSASGLLLASPGWKQRVSAGRNKERAAWVLS